MMMGYNRIGMMVIEKTCQVMGIQLKEVNKNSYSDNDFPCLLCQDAHAGGDNDDDLDLFSDETEEERRQQKRERPQRSPTRRKRVRCEKSSVLLDVKPWDDETDMEKLEEAVRSVQAEGLLWGASKLVPVGYGIKKLQIMMTIIDDLVSVDSLIEDHLTAEPCNEYIQSCDIVAFNKI
ncbi:hypothetical protein Droror1_Dr00025297 [Drosera rotundifolia]